MRKRYYLTTNSGYVGTDTKEEITDWFTDEDYKEYIGEITVENSNLFDELLGQAIEQQRFEWGIEIEEE